jgi:hypothetical protein
MIVAGNLYVGRSLRVTGAGCLTIVTQIDDGVAFADNDGNGRWSAGEPLYGAEGFRGPVEGSGNAYLGLPRGQQTVLELDCGLVIDGQLHVGADRAVVHGPVLLGSGGTALPDRHARFEVSGRRLPALQRSVLPGFVAVGAPRPGPVRLEVAGSRALYPASPTR